MDRGACFMKTRFGWAGTAFIATVAAVGVATAPATAGAANLSAGARAAAPHPARPSRQVRATMAELAHSMATSHHLAGKRVAEGGITGQIIGALGRPLVGACAIAYRGNALAGVGVAHIGGRFFISGLRPGAYALQYRDCASPSRYFPQWSGGAPTTAGARPVLVGPGRVTPLSPVRLVATNPAIRYAAPAAGARASAGGTISGTVRSTSGKRLPGMCVVVAGGTRQLGFGVEVGTGPRGSYSVPGIPPGSYKVNFSNGCNSRANYAPQWWKNAARPSQATAIHLHSHQRVTGIDGRLGPGAQITGTVRFLASSGRPLPGICVTAAGSFSFGSARTGPGGHYRITGLATSKYAVAFSPGCGNNGNYLPAVYRHPVATHTGTTTVGINGVLARGGRISGTVTDKQGTGVAGICVLVESNSLLGVTVTRPGGTYSVGQLSSGSYHASFSGGCGDNGSYAPQYYRDRNNLGAADAISVIAGQNSVGINATMAPGATLAGTVTNNSGQPLKGICVGVTTASISGLVGQGNLVNVVGTTAAGTYTLGELPPGNYQVAFFPGCNSPANLATQWFQSSPGFAGSSQVSAHAGVVTGGVNAVMQAAGNISGRLPPPATGRPLPGCVIATNTADGSGNGTFTNLSGRYTISGLEPGTYSVEFSPCGLGNYADQWYKGQPSPAGATPVTVTAAATTSGIDGALSKAGGISGVIRSSVTHRGLRSACAIAYSPVTGSFGGAVTSRNGSFRIKGLDSGPFLVEAGLCNQGASDLAVQMLPSQIQVTAPHTTGGVNATLQPGGTLAGNVWAGSPPRPAAGVCVYAVPVSGNGVAMLYSTGNRGHFLIRGLAVGSYDVYYSDDCRLSVSKLTGQWYQGQLSPESATPVPVKAGVLLSGINAILHSDGSISGTVTAAPAPAQPANVSLLSGICVTAIPLAPSYDPFVPATDTVAVSATGEYSITGLQPGRYDVRFDANCGSPVSYLTEWYNDVFAQAQATPVTVTSNADTPDINASMTTVGPRAPATPRS
jgi:hypothetical protein